MITILTIWFICIYLDWDHTNFNVVNTKTNSSTPTEAYSIILTYDSNYMYCKLPSQSVLMKFRLQSKQIYDALYIGNALIIQEKFRICYIWFWLMSVHKIPTLVRQRQSSLISSSIPTPVCPQNSTPIPLSQLRLYPKPSTSTAPDSTTLF